MCINIHVVNSHTLTRSYRDPQQQQFELKAQLREGLRSLPAPRNNFEIVVPELGEGAEEGERQEGAEFVEDAGNIDERNAQLRREEGGSYFLVWFNTGTCTMNICTYMIHLILTCLHNKSGHDAS